MVKGKVTKIMREAINRFAQKYNVEANKVSLFIHTKTDDYEPLYFKSVNGQVVKDENGKTKNLKFTRDILDKKIDFLGTEFFVSKALKDYFERVSKVREIEAKELNIMIGCSDLKAENLRFALLHKSTILTPITIEDVIGDD